MRNLFAAAGFILGVILFYRFHRAIWGAFLRFDARNVARINEEARDRADPTAHFRHTLQMADEQVETVQEISMPDARTSLPVTRYLFEAEMFADRDEAEAARARRVGVIARRFYAELPQALAGRETQAPLSARERAVRKWRRNFH